MTRKEILRIFSLGALAPFVQACDPGPDSGQNSPSTTPNSNPAFSMEEMCIAEMQRQMAAGQLTAEELVRQYLNRIEELDRQGPELNSVLEINPDALQLARQRDEERGQGKLRGPLHGIPILLKGNIDTGDQMATSAGALVLKDWKAPEDAFLVARLREAGAVILGKANLSEWANFRSTRSSSGWSGILGQTKNPYVLDRSPCGSSSGSGVAVSASLCAAAVGTETDGSIVCPSSMNGIVGIKPTLGLVSRSGVIPIAASCDTAGPMARSVEDAALLLGGMVGADPADPGPMGPPQADFPIDFAPFLQKDGLQGKRIGVGRTFFGFDRRVDELMEQALKDLEAQGATLVELPEYALPEQVQTDQWLVLKYEFRQGLADYFAKLPDGMGIRSLQDVIEYNRNHREASMPFFGQEILEMSVETESVSESEYREARDRMRRLAGPETIDRAVQAQQLDAIVTPTGSPAWTIDLVNGDHFVGGSSSPAAVSGYPSITVPAGFIHELPVGISFTGTAFSEPVLIEIAFAYEQATRHRKPPRYLPKI